MCELKKMKQRAETSPFMSKNNNNNQGRELFGIFGKYINFSYKNMKEIQKK